MECNYDVKGAVKIGVGIKLKFVSSGRQRRAMSVLVLRVQKAGHVNCYLLDAPTVYRAPLHLRTQLLFGECQGSSNKPQALALSCSLLANR